eukprot:jgi/Hompol1/4549/HPOL_000105-RA
MAMTKSSQKTAKKKLGAVAKYISRNHAVRKLQVSLAQFSRSLCILKGIYPVEPTNKKTLTKGSTAYKTFYYRKDIQFLLHEPILRVFREQRAHQRKISKAFSKRQIALVKHLQETAPVYTLDHVIKERHNYVMVSNSLKKVFLSIKGIYYQAEIRGQTITWITPYQFKQHVPSDVSITVMTKFLEIYETLVGFVNFKLYSDFNLVYPPKIDQIRMDSAAGLSSFIIEKAGDNDAVNAIQQDEQTIDSEQVQQSAKRLKSLSSKLASIEKKSSNPENDQIDENDDADISMDAATDDAPQPVAKPKTVEEEIQLMAPDSHNAGSRLLFSSCVFWLSREVPRYSLEFVIRAFGGRVGWDESSGSGSPFEVSDSRITHHISDRPVTTPGQLPAGVPKFASREYIQPQWVYDSINAGRLLKTVGYHLGETLPPHLSPFVVAREGDYVPDDPETAAAAAMASNNNLDNEDEDEDDDQVEEDEEDLEETARQTELEAEAAGVNFSEFAKSASTPASLKSRKTTNKTSAALTGKTASKETDEARELAKGMMSKKQQQLYKKMQYGNTRKSEAAENLRRKKAALKKQKQ